jgi:ATP-binding cassette subfamily C protein
MSTQSIFLKNTISACKTAFIYSLVFGFVINILSLATPIYSMQVLDRVLSSGNLNTLVMLTLVIILAVILLGMVQLARSVIMVQMGNWIDKRLSVVLFEQGIYTSSQVRTEGGAQQLRDLKTVKGFLTSPSLGVIVDLPWSIIFIIAVFILHPTLGFITVVGGGLLIGLTLLNELVTKKILDTANDQFIKNMQCTDESSRNSEVITVMGMMPSVMRNWQTSNLDVQHLQYQASQRSAIVGEITKFLRIVLQMSVTGVGAYLVLKHEMSSGGIIAGSTLVSKALSPFEVAINSWKGFTSARKAYTRLEESFKNHLAAISDMSLPAPKGEVKVENVYYSPVNAKKPVIKGVSFNVAAGEVVAVIGPSASGKSTLAKLIVGVYKPSHGSVRLDEADIYHWDRLDRGPHIGYVPQDVELFSGTVRENIARMQKDVSDEEVVEAAQFTGAHELILRLPNGYDTDIGVAGTLLSGGQRQRIALARAFFGNPKFVVLDEPNANLDSAGEQALSATLEQAKSQGITTIIISHRPSLMPNVDKILIMNDGMVAVFGARDEVLAQIYGPQQGSQIANQ